jgi:hypothetical protein
MGDHVTVSNNKHGKGFEELLYRLDILFVSVLGEIVSEFEPLLDGTFSDVFIKGVVISPDIEDLVPILQDEAEDLFDNQKGGFHLTHLAGLVIMDAIADDDDPEFALFQVFEVVFMVDNGLEIVDGSMEIANNDDRSCILGIVEESSRDTGTAPGAIGVVFDDRGNPFDV